MNLINEKITGKGLDRKQAYADARTKLERSMVAQHGKGRAAGVLVPAGTLRNVVLDPRSVWASGGVQRDYRAIGLVF